jgi:PAS domain S-box-containing protein
LLLILVVFFRYQEYQQAGNSHVNFTTITRTTTQKLELLIGMSKAMGHVQIALLRRIHAPEKDRVPVQHQIIRSQTDSYNAGFYAYEKLEKSKEEKEIFDQLKQLKNENDRARDTLLYLNDSGMTAVDPLMQSYIFKQQRMYEKFQDVDIQLSNLITAQSENEISGINANMLRFLKRREISSYTVVFLLLILAFIIGNVIRKIKKTNKALRAFGTKYRALFGLSPLPEYFIDTRTMKFVEVNRAAIKKYGYSREEFLNMTIYDLRRLGGEEIERFQSWLAPFTKIGSSFEAKTRHYKKNGKSLEVELRFKRIELMNREMFLVIAIDVTKKEKREREMNRAIIKAQENERKELGTELHDNICQILASSQLLLDSAKGAERSDSIQLIAKSKKHITEALTEIRNLSHRMAPIFFEVCSFKDAIHELLVNMNPENKYDVHFDFDPKIVSRSVSSDIQLNLFRILQEQLKNIVKYSKATSINVALSLHNGVIQMHIRDNGVGFDLHNVKRGIGLINMQRRAESFSGKFSIQSSPQNGCLILVELPIPCN